MKVGIHSDFHFETHADNGRTLVNELPELDVLIVAGDLSNEYNLMDSFEILCKKFEHVIFVIGNHDLWDSSFSRTRNTLLACRKRFPNLHALDNEIVEINGQRFLGATMFFPKLPMNAMYESHFVDFELIKNYREEVYFENEKAQQFLYAFTQPGDIIITHHMPARRSIHPIFERDAMNCFFLCDMEKMIESKRPGVWIHGHTHFSFDYQLCDTRIICNPWGYTCATNPKWEVDKILDI